MKSAMASRPSPNFDERPEGAPVDVLVLHYTGMKTAAEAIERLCDPAAKVSAHYLIDEAGEVTAMVAEEKRAWHAGQSFWRGERNVNGRSIGVELVNPGHEFGYRDFPAAQMTALRGLTRAILARHPIPARNVVGHSDVAPARKTDPGERFDWAGFAADGIGLWPGDAPAANIPPARVIDMLARYGYDTADGRAAVAAFQRHFRPARIDGIADADTAGRLAALLTLCELKRPSA